MGVIGQGSLVKCVKRGVWKYSLQPDVIGATGPEFERRIGQLTIVSERNPEVA